MIQLGKVEFNS